MVSSLLKFREGITNTKAETKETIGHQDKINHVHLFTALTFEIFTMNRKGKKFKCFE